MFTNLPSARKTLLDRIFNTKSHIWVLFFVNHFSSLILLQHHCNITSSHHCLMRSYPDLLTIYIFAVQQLFCCRWLKSCQSTPVNEFYRTETFQRWTNYVSFLFSFFFFLTVSRRHYWIMCASCTHSSVCMCLCVYGCASAQKNNTSLVFRLYLLRFSGNALSLASLFQFSMFAIFLFVVSEKSFPETHLQYPFVCVCVRSCVRAVCVCVCAWERKREREMKKTSEREGWLHARVIHVQARALVVLCGWTFGVWGFTFRMIWWPMHELLLHFWQEIALQGTYPNCVKAGEQKKADAKNKPGNVTSEGKELWTAVLSPYAAGIDLGHLASRPYGLFCFLNML